MVTSIGITWKHQTETGKYQFVQPCFGFYQIMQSFIETGVIHVIPLGLKAIIWFQYNLKISPTCQQLITNSTNQTKLVQALGHLSRVSLKSCVDFIVLTLLTTQIMGAGEVETSPTKLVLLFPFLWWEVGLPMPVNNKLIQVNNMYIKSVIGKQHYQESKSTNVSK